MYILEKQFEIKFKNSLIVHKPLTYQMVDRTSRAVVLNSDEASSFSY